MPYTQDPTVFRRLVTQVIANQEIRQQIENAELTGRSLNDFLDKNAPDIWAAASPKIADFNNAEKKAAGLDADYKSLQDHKPFYLRLVQDILPGVFTIFIFSLFSLFSSTVRHYVYGFFAGFKYSWVVGVLMVLAAVAPFAWANRKKAQAYTAALATAEAAFDSAKKEMENAKTLIEPAVVSAIEGHIREHLEQVSRPPFRIDLPETDTSGLSEVHNQEFEIITDNRRYLRGLIEKMSGGSIGIAGPRGCGKTTLLRSFWQEGVVDRKKLSIFATAPVKYEPREFLLHLFTSLCAHVISKETETEVPSAWNQMDVLRTMSTPRVLDTGVLASISLITAVFLLLVGLVVAVAGAGDSQKPSSPATQSAAAQKVESPAASSSSPGASSSSPAASPQPAASPAPTTATSTPTPSPEQKPAAASSNPLAAPAVPYFIWGIAALVIGAAARFGPGQPRPTNIMDFYFAPWVLENRRRKAEEEQQHLANVDAAGEELVLKARRALLGLRFQQSYSSGWSGALKLPIGLEGGANSAVSFAESQLSLPEVVNEYRGFLAEAAKRYDRILIAIDELDKLGSDEEAKTFLNSIKAIFGQEKVYYLVSISENAMSNFERRGLPIRDEFDSSFDDAVYIGYLDVAASRRLLARRANDPPPDVYRSFCHVLSGGLPRDLIRYCRKLYEHRRNNPNDKNEVAVTCPAIIRRDIRSKLDAMRHNLQRVPDEKKTADILTLIAMDTWDQKAVRGAIDKLEEYQREFAGEAARKALATQEPSDDLSGLANILEELIAYLTFALAVTNIFASIDGAPRYNELEKNRVFDRLAVARQWMSVNRAAAVATLSQLSPLLLQTAAVPAGAKPLPAPHATAQMLPVKKAKKRAR